MKILKIILIMIIVLVSVLAAETQYTLNDLIKLVEGNNLLIKISSIDNRIALMELRQSRRLPNPEFEYVFGQAELPNQVAKPKVWEYSLKLNIPNPISRHFLIRSKKSALNQAEIQKEIQRREILNQLKHHFYQFQFLNKSYSLLTDMQQRLHTMHKIIQAKVTIGETKEIELLRAKVKIQENQTELFGLTKKVANERTKINEILNYSLTEEYTLAEDFEYSPMANIENNLLELIKKAPIISMGKYHLAIKNETLKAKRYSLIESVELFTLKEKEIEGEIWKTGIGIEIPIFNAKGPEIKKARLEKEKAQIELEHAQKHLSADIQRIISEIRVLEQEIYTYNEAILKAGKENMILSEKLYRNGEIPLIVFLDSQNSFFNMMQRYYKSLTEWKILKADLQNLLGGIQ